MKSRALAAFAALSLLATPVAVQAAKPREVELHIEATAQVAPDRAVVPITISADGATEAQARANLREREHGFMAALAGQGIDASKVKAEGADGGKDPVKIEPEDAACSAADGAAAAMAVRPAASSKKGKVVHRVHDVNAACTAVNITNASKTFMVSLDDLGKLDRLQILSNEELGNGGLRPVFTQSDPAAARKKARAEALAKANAEADAHADALGYRVVRIVRISNARPAISIFDMLSFITTLDNKTASLQPSWFGATVVETVAIDYVIAPN